MPTAPLPPCDGLPGGARGPPCPVASRWSLAAQKQERKGACRETELRDVRTMQPCCVCICSAADPKTCASSQRLHLAHNVEATPGGSIAAQTGTCASSQRQHRTRDAEGM